MLKVCNLFSVSQVRGHSQEISLSLRRDFDLLNSVMAVKRL